jgi:hypothetical protein
MHSPALAAILVFECALAAGNAQAPSDPLRQLRFSPDGRYVLAQDKSEIAVLTVSPLAILFRVPAEFAGDAQFTPDSRQIVFVRSLARADQQAIAGPDRPLLTRSDPHVERWRVADGDRAESTEVKGLRCATEQLSPDGRTMACDDADGALRVVDVASAETLLEKRKFVKPIPLYNYLPGGYVDLPSSQSLGDPGQAAMDFSPDGRFLLARPSGGAGKAVAWDLREKRLVELAGRLRTVGDKLCVFVAPHRLLIPPSGFQAKHRVVTADLVAFPSTEILSKLKVPDGPLFRAADPEFVIVRPFGKGFFWNPNAKRAAAAELATGEAIVSDTPALDVFGRYYVAEPSAGTVGLYERGKGLLATVALHEK